MEAFCIEEVTPLGPVRHKTHSARTCACMRNCRGMCRAGTSGAIVLLVLYLGVGSRNSTAGPYAVEKEAGFLGNKSQEFLQRDANASRSVGVRSTAVFLDESHKDNGTHAAVQCNDTARVCYCMSKHNVRLPVLKSAAGEPLLDLEGCEALRKGCEDARQEPNHTVNAMSCFSARNAGLSVPSLVGSFVPRCNTDGSFAAYQYHASTGYSWCSDPTGHEIRGTARGPSEVNKFDPQSCRRLVNMCTQAAQPQHEEYL
eukprot:TRINITY_DN46335_c0_g1_i1.p1 TRINITY_DN46335_c0_g1~~TRINITY_DN46335_c0_g1_i1.p1  ORF type:complete len:277 (+),score=24.56 TRINITY_DN46335_c0_g1_i1:62-832(+)